MESRWLQVVKASSERNQAKICREAEGGRGAPWWPVGVGHTRWAHPGFVFSSWFRDLNVCDEIKQINVCVHA